jgi:hypothetical protein
MDVQVFSSSAKQANIIVEWITRGQSLSSADDWRYGFSLLVPLYAAIRPVIYNHLLRNWSF